MAITVIKRLENRCRTSNVALLNRETPTSPGSGTIVPAQGTLDGEELSMFVPWATDADAFRNQRLELQVDGRTVYWIWQAARWDGDHVRFSKDGTWHDPGTRAHGASVVEGDRTLVVMDTGFELQALPQVLVDTLRKEQQSMLFRLCETQAALPEKMVGLPSVPKRHAVAFSMAGPPSDAFDRGTPGGRFLYRDSGKRYEFHVDDAGVVTATHPDGTTTRLDKAISYNAVRDPGPPATAPPFDLIAANGGRMLAKERDGIRLYIATMDHLFVHGDDWGEMVVPSNYFKLDPEFQKPGARMEHLTRHVDGAFAGHPAAERFPVFRLLLQLGLTDTMIVNLQRRVWHEVDVRPPVGANNAMLYALDAARRVLDELRSTSIPWAPLSHVWAEIDKAKAQLQATRNALARSGPQAYALPPGVSGYEHVCFTDGTNRFPLKNICHYRMLDLGVGAVHHHEQWDGTTGGELQPMHAPEIAPGVTFADLYRIVNGPIRDGDGFIDGTCNYYALVQLVDDEVLKGDDDDLKGDGLDMPNAFGVLFFDEQSYFSGRWRLAHPDDWADGGLSLATALHNEVHEPGTSCPCSPSPPYPVLYGWNPAHFWCPFRAGHITRRSRLATSRQVLVVNGQDPETRTPALYSVNYSFSSMDRTWRWRELPSATPRYFGDDDGAGREDIRADVPGGTVVYPETLRLREDMTLHLKGAKDGVLGRWYQRYLPSGNQLVPPEGELIGGKPARPYRHQWRFLSEPAFAAADWFSHLGVHAPVDSRCHFYRVEPLSAEARAALDKASTGPWIYAGEDLYVRAVKFSWSAPLRIPEFEVDVLNGTARMAPKRPASVMNAVTRLRIVRRDADGWIAMHWDKRDDDLLPFSDLPKDVEVVNGAARAKLRLHPATWVSAPPAVAQAEIVLTGDSAAPLAVVLRGVRDVWRVKMATLADMATTRPPSVVDILDAPLSAFTMRADGSHHIRWSGPAAAETQVQGACTPAGAEAAATSLWFEDKAGHVGVPDHLRWLRSVRPTAVPSSLPLRLPVQARVDARDAMTGAPVTGAVHSEGVVVGATNMTFTTTFLPQRVRHFDPERRVWITEEAPPRVSVVADGYVDADVSVRWYWPEQRVWVDQAWLPIGRPTRVTVRAQDTTTGAALAGRVRLAGQDVASTGAPFSYTFGSSPPTSVVDVPGYRSMPIPWPPLRRPRLAVSVQPYPVPVRTAVAVTVRATDADSGTPVDGSVAINGQAVGRTNAAFTYTFVVTRIRVWDSEARVWTYTFRTPEGLVSAPGYPDVPLEFGL